MSFSNELNTLIEQIIAQFNQGKGYSTQGITKNEIGGNENNNKNTIIALTPQKVLIILGLLADVLHVRSILIDRSQIVEILLDGSLKRKNNLDKMLDEIGTMPFDDVLRAILGRL